MSDDPLQTPLQDVRGISADRIALLRKLRLRTVEDVLYYMPRDVLDLTEVTPVPKIKADEMQTVVGQVVDIDGRTLSNGRLMTGVLLDCDGHYVRGLWFNQSWVAGRFQSAGAVLFSGKPKRKGGRWEFSHPKLQFLNEDAGDNVSGGIHPRYGLTEGLKMHELRWIIGSVVDEFAQYASDHLPDAFREQHKLMPLRDAIRLLHRPTTREEFDNATRRLVFDDLLEFQLGLALRRRAWKLENVAQCLPVTPKIDARIRRLFPFRFTAGQDQAVREISEDLNRPQAMHRLLQADVGAGKTAIAIYAMLVCIAAGQQTVLMAPTEVLVQQHWATIEQTLMQSRVERVCLTGSLTAATRRDTLERIRTGAAQLIVGTQAIIQEGVELASPGLVVIDEQHKFGVMQRAMFSTGTTRPHVLVMTATPIPRSLCLTQFGDLDLTTIAELPPGRQRIVTSRVTGESLRRRAWNFVRKQLRTGRQAYVVCPRVEERPDEAESTDLSGSAEAVFRELTEGELSEFSIGLMHGRLDAAEKAAQMDRFRSGSTQVLVSTTVVEVGVDVPNATLMVIQQAERFGLSQLHQLRGRVGRGRFQGYCLLFSETNSDESSRRLSALEESTDGFHIAEVDFELRGPGDVLGIRQHGELPLRVADPVRDQVVLLDARHAAFELVRTKQLDSPDFAPLKIRVLERFGRIMDLPQSG